MGTEVHKKASEAAKAWRLANLDRYREYQRNYKREKRIEALEVRRVNRFRGVAAQLTDDQYHQIWEHQGGKCKICGKYRAGRKLQVRMIADSNDVRALLCDRCSIAVETIKNFLFNANYHQAIKEYLNVPAFEFRKETGLPVQPISDDFLAENGNPTTPRDS